MLQVQDESERLVYGLSLGSCQPAGKLSEARDLARAQLLDQHTCALITQFDLGSEGCRRSASRSRRNEDVIGDVEEGLGTIARGRGFVQVRDLAALRATAAA